MPEKNLKQLMEKVAAEKLNYVLEHGQEDEYVDEAFEQGIAAVKVYNDMVKIDDAHDEELKRQELEKEKQKADNKFKMSESTKEKIMKGIELGAVVIVAPVIGYFSNKNLAKFLCKVEEFETFTTTAGRSLGKMFKFK